MQPLLLEFLLCGCTIVGLNTEIQDDLPVNMNHLELTCGFESESSICEQWQ